MSDKKKNKKDKHKSSFLTDPLTKKRFKKELKAATRSQFRPLSRELQKQNRISLLQSQRTSRYFKDYQQAIGRGRSAVQGAYNDAAASMGNYAAAAGSQDAALRAQLGQQASADASLYGGPGDTGAPNLALLGQANRVRAGADVAGAIQGQGANSYAYLTSQKSNAKLGRIEALNAEAANRRQISADRQDLIREKADFRNTYLADAREGERRYELALKELRNSNRQAAKDRKFQSKEAAKDRRNSNNQAAKDRNASDQADKDGSKKERKQAFKKAAALLGAYDRKDVAKDPGKFVAALVNKGIPANIARRAVRQALKNSGGGGGKGGGGKGDKGFDWGSVWGN